MTKSTLEMTHQEWLADRRKGIGGSDVATILGLNKWKSPYQLWLEKTDQITLDDNADEAAYWGTALEPLVANRFSEVTGKKVRRRNQVFEHTDYPFLRANIDRDVVGENALLECKTANQFLAKDWDGEEIPMSYLCQIQHYMNVLERDHAYIAVLIGGQKFIWKKVERDQELIDLITKRLVEFWQMNVVDGKEPPIDGSSATSDFLNERYSEEGTNEIMLPSEFDNLIVYRNQLKEDEKIIKEKIAETENQIKSELGKQNALIGITKQFVITWKAVASNRLNKKLLAAKYPNAVDDPDIYQTSESKRMTIKEIN